MIKTVVVIPTLTLERGSAHAQNVLAHLKKTHTVIRQENKGNRLLVVNGSPENHQETSDLLAELNLPNLTDFHATFGKGVGHARLFGIKKAFEDYSADLAIIINNNPSHPAEFCKNIIKDFTFHGWDLGIAARPGKVFTMENFSLPMLATETKINFRTAAIFDLFHLFPDNYPDFVCGISAFSRKGWEGFNLAVKAMNIDLLETVTALNFGFDVFMPVLFHLLGFKIGAVPFEAPPYFKNPAQKEAEHRDPAQFLVREQHYVFHELAIRKLIEINAIHKLTEINAEYPTLSLAAPDHSIITPK